MRIEHNRDEILIKLSSAISMDELRELTNYLRFREIVADVKVSQSKVDKLASEINTDFWKKNRERLLG